MKLIFTRHAVQRMEKRKIMEIDVLDAIHYPERIYRKDNKYFFQRAVERGCIEVCCEKKENNIKVITAYWV